jgi:WD40 repeat protein
LNEDGGDPIVLDGHAVFADDPIDCGWTRGGLLVTGHWTEGRVRIWEMPTGRLVRTIEFNERCRWQVGETHLLAEIWPRTDPGESRPLKFRRWKLPGGAVEDLGSADFHAVGATSSIFEPGGDAWLYTRGDSVYRRPLPTRPGVPDSMFARHSSEGIFFGDWWPQGFYSRASNGEIILWTSENGVTEPVRRLREPENATTPLRPEPGGRWAIDPDGNVAQRDGKRLLWDLEGLLGARPVELRRSGGWLFVFSDFHPTGDWVASSTKNGAEISLWPLPTENPYVVDGYDTFWRLTVGFTPDGRFLVSNWGQDRVRMRPLPGSGKTEVIDLKLPHAYPVRGRLAVSPKGHRILSAGKGGNTFLLSTRGEDPLQLSGFDRHDVLLGGAFSPSGNLVATATLWPENQPTLRVWVIETGETLIFDVPNGELESVAESPYQNYEVENVVFADESTLYTSGCAGLLRWDLEEGGFEQIIDPAPNHCLFMIASADSRRILTFESAEPLQRRDTLLHDLVTREVRQVEIPAETTVLSLGPAGTTWVAGEENGLIWVGRFDEGKAHILAGHKGPVKSLAISTDRKWVASSGEDKTLRLWPMPDLSKPPLHTLPRQELIAKLKSLTNLRAVRDAESPTGWTIEVGPFPGWESVPEW